MAKYDFDIGILGGGAAGLTVAAGASQLGAKTLLIEKEKALGGDCLHFGCVPSKTLIKTAKLFHQMKNAERYGLPRPDILPVDFRVIAKRIQSVISTIQEHDSPERFCKLGAKVEFGNPTFVDEHSICLNGKPYSAKTWVVATGSSPSIPPIEGLDKTSYITNKEIFSLDSLPKSMIVIGAGPIAIEMGQAFCRLGTKVYVIQRSGQILSKEDKDMADLVMNQMGSEGVTFYLNSTIMSVKDLGSEREVLFESEGKQRVLRAEAIHVALGRNANISGMGLEHIGVECDARGIKVDKRLRTNHGHLYAAGDVTGAYQFTHAAGY
jgi:pyruvate/2-oxoglutarate dehydrogenase complex dihydrolipoamide dehydrogenase (E3) component